MKLKDLSEDVELLTWKKYFNESSNIALQFLAEKMDEWIEASNYDDWLVTGEAIGDFKALGVSSADVINAIPLVSCLRASKRPELICIGEKFFLIIDDISCQLLDVRKKWAKDDEKERFISHNQCGNRWKMF